MPLKNNEKPTLLLIDGMSLVFQSFYAIRNLTNDAGMSTGAVLGFVRQVKKLIAKVKPEYIVAVFDSPGPTFRNEIYPEYKANRQSPPEDFHTQLPYIFNSLKAMGILQCSQSGFEADDLIGTLAKVSEPWGVRVLIATSDKDMFQLVDERVRVLRMVKDDVRIYGSAEVRERMGVPPEQIIDYLALVGDSSDNIPGVPRIGPKTAASLLGQIGSLEGLLANLDQIANVRQKGLLEEHAEQARLSYKLAKIACDVKIDLSLDQAKCEPDMAAPALLDIYRELGFHALLREAPVSNVAKAQPVVPPAKPEKVDYQTISTEEQLQALVDTIRKAGRLAIDTETTGLDTMVADLVGISISCQAGTGFYIPVGHDFTMAASGQLPLETVSAVLGPILADPAIGKIAQNAKYDIRILARHGMPVSGLTFDTMLASYVLNPDSRHGLKAMTQEFLGIKMTDIEELIGKGKSLVTMDMIEIERTAPYACADADMTLRLADLYADQLKKESLDPLFRDIEMPLIEVLDAMETEGVTLNVGALKELGAELRSRLDKVATEIYSVAGCIFNVKSPKQVADTLFVKIGLKPRSKGKGSMSTRSEVLEDLRKEHPLPGLILEYRHLDKLLSTYVDSLPQMVLPRTGRIHSSFNQFIAATGRLSSSSPNLQNIPKRGEIAKVIRSAFVPNGPDHLFLAADYSQIELRILAHFSEDSALRNAFIQNEDIHAQTAAKIFDMMPEMVTDDMRSQAKVINFGILYGMSAHRLSRELGISRGQAQSFIDEYFSAYPGVHQWSDALVEEATRNGFVTTLSGRRRPLPDLGSRNRNEREAAARMALNTPIQGTAADMIKVAMVNMAQELKAGGFKARMTMQVHDELIFSVPEGELESLRPVVRRVMEEAMPLSVPVRVDMESGRTWAEC